MSCPDVDSLRLAIGAEAEAIDRNQLTEWSFDTAIPDNTFPCPGVVITV